jgi:hypothetical protein
MPYLTQKGRVIRVFRDSNETMEVLMTEYETLKRLVAEAEEDVNKAVGGNKAAGTRVRKKMQEIKAAATDIRKKILESRNTEPGAA